MSESFKFEYKRTNMFHDIQPAGLSVYGERGLSGKDGTSGSSLYFVNYVEITDTIKSTLLRNIQNSYTLDGQSYAQREYQNNDLIICKIGQSIYNNVYKITKNQSTNTYNIEKIGQLVVRNSVKNVFDTIKSIQLNKGSNIKTDCHVPVNRSYDVDSSSNFRYNFKYKNGLGDYDLKTTIYENAYRTLFGFSLSPTISITDRTNASNYNFFLKIYINNKKSILGRNSISIRDGYTNANTASDTIRQEPVTVDNNIDMISFDKIIEIPVTKYYDSSLGEELIDSSYGEFFLSDMACDKLHPSLNNYSSSFFDPYRNRGYLTSAIDSFGYPFHAFNFSYLNSKYIINGQNIIGNSQNQTLLDQVLYKQENPYTSSSDVIQYSKNPVESGTYCRVNFRSGESAYFSGMLPDTIFSTTCFKNTASEYTKSIGSLSSDTFDQYIAAQRSLNYNINELEETVRTYVFRRETTCQNYVCSEINKFIFNEDNVFELVCIDKQSGRTRSKIYTLNQLMQ